MSTLPLPHPSFLVPSSPTSLSAAATTRAPFRTRRKSPTMLSGTLAVSWLAQAQPSLLTVVRARLMARQADAGATEAACQLLVQFLQQIARQQALPTMTATDLEQALWRARHSGTGEAVDPTIAQWVASTAAATDAASLATAVAGVVAEETARLMQAIVAILLDPTAALTSA